MYVAVLIGQQMRISASTTIWHRRNSYKHCNVRDQAYLVIPMYFIHHFGKHVFWKKIFHVPETVFKDVNIATQTLRRTILPGS